MPQGLTLFYPLFRVCIAVCVRTHWGALSLHVNMCVCMQIAICGCVRFDIQTLKHVPFTKTCVTTYIFSCVDVHMCMCAHTFMCAFAFVCTHTRFAFINVCARTPWKRFFWHAWSSLQKPLECHVTPPCVCARTLVCTKTCMCVRVQTFVRPQFPVPKPQCSMSSCTLLKFVYCL